jgi:hypothetical protein
MGQQLFWIVYYWFNYDFSNLPVHISFAIHLAGHVLSITFCTGLAHGLVLLNWKAILTLALSTSFVSTLATLMMFVVLDQWGIRVGTGNAAISKVTAICTMIAGITGGVVLGSAFSWFVEEERRPPLVQHVENK